MSYNGFYFDRGQLDELKVHTTHLATHSSELTKLSDNIVEINNNVSGDASDGIKVYPFTHDSANGKARALFSDASHNLKVKDDTLNAQMDSIIGATNNSASIGDGQSQLKSLCLGYDRTNEKARSILVDANGNVGVMVSSTSTYENVSLTNASALLIYGSSNGTSIDMNGYKHLVIKIKATATTSMGTLQNLRLYYSNDDSDFCLGEVISLDELPLSATNYQGVIRVQNCGFRYVQLFSVGVSASPTVYSIHYSRSN